MISHEAFMLSAFNSNAYVTTLCQLPGFVVDFITADLMHTSDLGVLQYVLASVLLELFFEMGGVVARSSETLSELVAMIKCASKHIGQDRVPSNNLTMKMIRGTGSPKLLTKAAETRNLLFCVSFILSHFMPADTTHKQIRRSCITHFTDMYSSLSNWVEGSGAAAAASGRKALCLYGELAGECLQNGSWQSLGYLMWRVYPKMHLLQHCLEDQVRIAGNPQSCWCYSDESEIGAAVQVAEACHVSTLHRSVMQKHRLLDGSRKNNIEPSCGY